FRLRDREGGAVERCLIFELLGRSANLFLLAARGLLLGYCLYRRSEFRAPPVRARYQPPPGRESLDGIPVGPEAIDIARDRFGGARGFLEKVSPLFSRDLDAAGADAAAAERRLATPLEATRSADLSPGGC